MFKLRIIDAMLPNPTLGTFAHFPGFRINLGYPGFKQISSYRFNVPLKTLANSDQSGRYERFKLRFRETFFDMILTLNHVTFWGIIL